MLDCLHQRSNRHVPGPLFCTVPSHLTIAIAPAGQSSPEAKQLALLFPIQWHRAEEQFVFRQAGWLGAIVD